MKGPSVAMALFGMCVAILWAIAMMVTFEPGIVQVASSFIGAAMIGRACAKIEGRC